MGKEFPSPFRKMEKTAAIHLPVLTDEVEAFLAVRKNGLYIDTTVGGGGHSQRIIALGGKVLGIDQDQKALKVAAKHLASACPPGVLNLAHGNFVDLEKIAKKYRFVPADGILFDLGVSGYQLEEEGRGFSFLQDEPLDMRMDPESQAVTAADLVNSLPKRRLYEAFYKLADERLAWPIAQAIHRARSLKPIATTGELAQVVERVYKKRHARSKIHPATKVFLSLRILANSELENLEKALPQAFEILKPEGRLVVISFHSGEDRIVKNFFKAKQKSSEAEVLTKKPVRPQREEIEKNPRCRSARLRALEKVKNETKT